MIRVVCIIAAVLVASSAASAANRFRPHNADEKACGADAHRFCKQDIPDQFRVASCLQSNRDKISRACRTALEGHGM